MYEHNQAEKQKITYWRVSEQQSHFTLFENTVILIVQSQTRIKKLFCHSPMCKYSKCAWINHPIYTMFPEPFKDNFLAQARLNFDDSKSTNQPFPNNLFNDLKLNHFKELDLLFSLLKA